jgi:hypothetical protein
MGREQELWAKTLVAMACTGSALIAAGAVVWWYYVQLF